MRQERIDVPVHRLILEAWAGLRDLKLEDHRTITIVTALPEMSQSFDRDTYVEQCTRILHHASVRKTAQVRRYDARATDQGQAG